MFLEDANLKRIKSLKLKSIRTQVIDAFPINHLINSNSLALSSEEDRLLLRLKGIKF